MSKRTTVKVDIERIEIIIKANGWRNSYFAEVIMKKQRGWVSEWKRGKNLPSPEEAAHICLVFDVSPDDILLHEGKTPEETEKCLEDIETVRKLVETERAKESAPNFNVEGWTDLQKAAIQFVLSLPPEKLEVFLKMGRAAFEEKEHE